MDFSLPPIRWRRCATSSARNSLAFLSIDGMYRAMGEPGRDPANPKFSDHCFTGAYPTHLTDQTQVEPQPRQLSLLAEAS